MKTLRLLSSVFLMAATFALTACEKEVQQPVVDQYAVEMFTRADLSSYFGTPAVVDFLAGQHTLAGTITVGNDAENLYITYETTGDWMIKATHLYAGTPEGLPVNKQNSPQNGHFPYKGTFSPYTTSQTYTIPLSELPQCLTIAAHAEVVKVVDGVVVQSETAWGKGDKIGKSWAMKFEYCIQTPPQDDPDPVVEYQYETAWANGGKYNTGGKGNWATYTPYIGEQEVILYAGQTHVAGTVRFSEVIDGEVTITISFNDTWSLNNSKTMQVKIQGYDNAPSGNPAPGQFLTYQGSDLVITVPAFAFYGIHLDVMKPIVPAME